MLAYTYKEQGKFVLEEKEKPGILEEQDAIVRYFLHRSASRLASFAL